MLTIHSIKYQNAYMPIDFNTTFINGRIFEAALTMPEEVVEVVTTIEGIKTFSTMEIKDVAMWLARQLQKWG